MLQKDEVVECSILNELELTAKELVRFKAVRKKVTSFDATQREGTAELEGRMDFSEELAAAPNTTPKLNKSRKRA